MFTFINAKESHNKRVKNARQKRGLGRAKSARRLP